MAEPRDAVDQTREKDVDDRLARRYYAAREFGFSREDAREFADSEVDIGVLRGLERKGCPPRLAARIVL